MDQCMYNPSVHIFSLVLLLLLLWSLAADSAVEAFRPNGRPIPEASDRPTVRTPLGDVRGHRVDTPSNILVDQFLGIPFARPPLGDLRFHPPVPAPKWTGVLEATSFGHNCLQQPPSFGRPVPRSWAEALAAGQAEDCLYLNVYRPSTAPRRHPPPPPSTTAPRRHPPPPPSTTVPRHRMPVMVWIHGGGFNAGAGSYYQGEVLAARGVVMVTVNYRLDVFGFLSNQDDVIPGNYAMLDQIMALKWVQENIGSFGGDPDLVTVCGESAGAASVSLHLLSPLAHGLFRRAIMASGSSLSPWALYRPAYRLPPSRIASLIGALVGCEDNDSAKKLECLRDVDARTLINASVQLQTDLGFHDLYLVPVVEKTFGYLPDLPIKLLAGNQFRHVDTMRGFNRAEAGMYLDSSVKSFSDTDFAKVLREHFRSYDISNEDEITTDLIQRYGANESSDRGRLLAAIAALTDTYFRGPALLEARMEAEKAPEKRHYVYEFDHKPCHSPLPSWIPAAHAEDLFLLFGWDGKGGKPADGTDQLVQDLMLTLWTNFAKYGDPTRTVPRGAVRWSGYNPDTAKGLRISSSSREVSFKNHNSTYAFPTLLNSLDTAPGGLQ